MESTKIYLIRHAEAEGNLYRRSQGQYNSNVTSLGRRQIGALAERFRDETLDALWSSDLNRTRSTASAIRKYHPDIPFRLEPLLREIDVGVWEDRPWGDLAQEWPEQMQLFRHDPGRWSVPDAEPYEHVGDRMFEALRDIGRSHPGGTVAAVSHALAIRAVVARLLGVPTHEITTVPYGDNTAVTLVTVSEDGTVSLDWYNDASHLDEAGLSTYARQSWWRNKEKSAPAAQVYSHFVPLDPVREGALYERLYADTWRASHGDLRGFSPAVYLRTAVQHAKLDPDTVMKLYTGEELTGAVELDPNRGAEDGAGWISLLYIEPAFRGRRLGAQLIGHAVSYFRRRDRHCLRLHVAESNPDAIAFYEALGFRRIGSDRGAVGMLRLMELDIRQRILTPEEI